MIESDTINELSSIENNLKEINNIIRNNALTTLSISCDNIIFSSEKYTPCLNIKQDDNIEIIHINKLSFIELPFDNKKHSKTILMRILLT
ncbi:hypothetical protein D3C80_942230 [compost metagenome]